MRVLIYEPEPRMCGPMTWAFHLQEGMRRLGHECYLLCSTKSGKARVSWGRPTKGGKWWSRMPDIVVSNDELVATLDSADVIVMPEIRNMMQDNAAEKIGEVPTYVKALRETKTPWTTALHGSAYAPKTAKFVEHVLAAAPGQLISVSDFSPPTHPAFAAVPWVTVPMPYAMRNPVDAPATLRQVTGQLGRFQGNKGPHVGAFAACEWMGDGYVHEIWGSCSQGAGASETYLLYRELYRYYPEHQKVRYKNTERELEMQSEDGNIISPYAWDFKAKGRTVVRYMGNYMDPVATAARFGVHVALTSSKFAGGLVEYSSLESMDAGCLAITPAHFSDPAWFRMMVLDDYVDTGSVERFTKNRFHQTESVGRAMRHCMDVIEMNPNEAHAIVAHNRRAIEQRNNPAMVAQMVIDCALTRRHW